MVEAFDALITDAAVLRLFGHDARARVAMPRDQLVVRNVRTVQLRILHAHEYEHDEAEREHDAVCDGGGQRERRRQERKQQRPELDEADGNGEPGQNLLASERALQAVEASVQHVEHARTHAP